MSDDTNPHAPPPRKRLIGRKLLVAAVGVATINYAACNMGATSGNLIAPPTDAQTDAVVDAPPDAIIMSGNLIAPPPPEAGPDGGTDGSPNGG